MSVIPPGSTIGIIGGGQLGRMTVLAAARLGYRCHVFAPEADGPAAQVAAGTTRADYGDDGALERFAAAVDVATFEFENVPFEPVRRLAERVPVRPGWECLRVSQDRAVEKEFVTAAGAATAPWRTVDGPAALARALAEIGRPAVLKTARLGYDGKGQVLITDDVAIEAAWQAMGAERGVLEGFVDFEREVSVIVARGLDGATAAYDAVENRHVNHILDTTCAPAPIPPLVAREAQATAARLAAALDLVGLLAVEMFVTPDGGLLVNEVAPRPHNSGHWTIDACPVSQFEQLVRAVCGLPLGSTARHSDAVMRNLLGDAADAWPRHLAEPGVCLHLYGKGEARPGRKMGHLTRLHPKGSLGGG